MKSLLKILIGGTAFFLVMAIGQEWSFFSDAWFGTSQGRDEMPVEEKKAASDAVYRMLALAEHFYASGGDPRFAERMPVSDAVVEEMITDVRYLGRNHLVQFPSLERLDVTAVRDLGEGKVEIHTRELWEIEQRGVTDEMSHAPSRPHRTKRKYLLSRGPRGWKVEGWDIAGSSGS